MSFEKIFKQKYLLASKSPRRIKLLKQVGFDFKPIDSKAPEWDTNEFKPIEILKVNTGRKANSVLSKALKKIIIAADTIVAIDKHILHKPSNEKEAFSYLKMLNGKKHTVYTGILVINPVKKKSVFSFEKTSVYFRNLSDKEIKYYIKHHNPLDKAGSYGIQDDFGCLLVKKIVGDYYNVVGLPMVLLYKMLLKII
jgi:septum formation protein